MGRSNDELFTERGWSPRPRRKHRDAIEYNEEVGRSILENVESISEISSSTAHPGVRKGDFDEWRI